ncbi:DegT/DnrJ/EryC1/StrS family aminotransferase [Geopsychrobacter electrodiphilus]|uniref:DegT/DnrJ/EryC1/StrS family aminotransferase n=1 Tax=Geopsychrobacter electrodiphilus TaxID=225196 RepID=UPI00035D2AFE|nr:DegT/DnrJ/EryC1/StrS family aminotransferase [Geopsychrobacter electrodiphilus]
MDFIDLKTQQAKIREQLDSRMNKVLEHGQYIMGPEVQELETRLAGFTGVKHCISVSSGTDALLIAMLALGIGTGDEVITSPFTFIATGEMIALLGARPVFVDIDPQTYNLDPSLVEKAITAQTMAIMPISLYGQCADFDAINAIAERHGIPVIEDGAQSFGATYNGRRSCALSTIGCTSFFPSKPLGGYGDGGACFTDDDELASKMRQIRVHGQDRRYNHPLIGINGRLDTLQAAILLAKLDIFSEEVQMRGTIGSRYSKKLCDTCITPHIASANTSVFAQYCIQVSERDRFVKNLKGKGVPTAVHYPIPLHLQPAFTYLGYKNGDFSVSEKVASRIVSLPIYPYLSEKDQNFIVMCAKEALS